MRDEPSRAPALARALAALSVLAAALLLGWSPDACADGMNAPMDLTGSFGGEETAERHPFEVSLAGGLLATRLEFPNGDERRLDEATALASASLQAGALSLSFGIGAVLGGSLNGAVGSYRLQAGPEMSASAGWTFLSGRGAEPYLAASVSAGFAAALTENGTAASGRAVQTTGQTQPLMTAIDLRLALVVGKELFGLWLPYAGAAVFGGPVYLSSPGNTLIGTDDYHYRVAVGSSFKLPARLRLFVEAAFLGELSAAVGLGERF